ncbi:Chaperone protein clpB 2 [Monoraphidium neglectum]|uniref:Chaperone protein clpB 2 n=1 Tax=Monoraphidium neglectum TaxID=145388 RepID=A0A0D2IWA6_9CHLO|nr:Chaperone protein clpB 2 [Monoraphidium neglectum]KIY92222.1 Chaperone protein clpB 2 [Monoraphidium neglectum]|eukprot:XP_013891242.1 Chaperone protein clpB 2 [Monoraphidium neglectum]
MRVMEAVHRHLRPEFINTNPPSQLPVDEFIVFEPLTHPEIRDIVGLKTAALAGRLAAQRISLVLGDSALDYLADKVGASEQVYESDIMGARGVGGVSLVLGDSALDSLADKGFDPVYGARPVKRALQRELQTRLAQALLRGEFSEGDTVRVEAGATAEEGLRLIREGPAAAAAAAAVAAAAAKSGGAGAEAEQQQQQQQQQQGEEGAAAGPAAATAKPGRRRVVVSSRGKKVPAAAKEEA